MDALTAGYLLFQGQKVQALILFDGQVFLIPDSPSVPLEIFDEVRRIGSLSIFSNDKFRLYPHDLLNGNSAHELIHLGLSRNYLHGSFFILNTEVLTGKAAALCPHANFELMGNELRSLVLSILGSSGHVLSLKNHTCFCVFYSHTVIDTELVITQVAKILIRTILSNEAGSSLVGPWYTAKLSDKHAESGLNSFIETVEPRLKI